MGCGRLVWRLSRSSNFACKLIAEINFSFELFCENEIVLKIIWVKIQRAFGTVDCRRGCSRWRRWMTTQRGLGARPTSTTSPSPRYTASDMLCKSVIYDPIFPLDVAVFRDGVRGDQQLDDDDRESWQESDACYLTCLCKNSKFVYKIKLWFQLQFFITGHLRLPGGERFHSFRDLKTSSKYFPSSFK